MSLRHEQHQSLIYTRELLFDLLHPSTRPKTVAVVEGVIIAVAVGVK